MVSNVTLPLRFILELIHPLAGWQLRVCEAIITEPGHHKNAMEDQKVEEHGELFEAVDMALTMSLSHVFIEALFRREFAKLLDLVPDRDEINRSARRKSTSLQVRSYEKGLGETGLL